MRMSHSLVCLTLLGSALSWSPYFVSDLPFWISLACSVLGGCLSIALLPSAWPWIVLASGVGTCGGFVVGFLMYPPSDPIAGPWVPYVAALMTLFVMCVGLLAGVILRRQSVSSKTVRRTIWAAVVAWVACGPMSVALAPTLIPHNEQLAAERFTALKNAMEKAVEAYRTSHVSDGRALKPHYFGPAFSNSDWARIASTPVEKDGYSFIIYATEKGGYTISATPVKDHVSGVRRFCTDESGKLGCDVEWNGSRHACLPCSQ